jgi:hypothetical protein
MPAMTRFLSLFLSWILRSSCRHNHLTAGFDGLPEMVSGAGNIALGLKAAVSAYQVDGDVKHQSPDGQVDGFSQLWIAVPWNAREV